METSSNSEMLQEVRENTPSASARPCLICYNPFVPLLSSCKVPKKTIDNEESSTDDQEKAPVESNQLEDHFGIMFVVRTLLRLPESTIEELLTTHGNPSNWGKTCCPYCNEVVEDAEKVAQKIINHQMKLQCLQERVKDEILISVQDKSECAEDIKKSSSIALIDDIRFKFVQRSEIEGVTISEAGQAFRESRDSKENLFAPPYSPLSVPPEDMPPSPVFPSDVEESETFEICPDFLVKEQSIHIPDEFMDDLPDAYLNPEVELTELDVTPKSTKSKSKKKSRAGPKSWKAKVAKKLEQENEAPVSTSKTPRRSKTVTKIPKPEKEKVKRPSRAAKQRKPKPQKTETDRKSTLLLTARNSERKYRFKCPQCVQHFPSEYFRDAHNRRKHFGIKLCFICDKCGKAYDRNQSLEIHKKNCLGDGTFVHPVDPRLQEVPKFKCTKCPRHFPSELTRDAHVKRYHEGVEKPFMCDICKRSYKKQGDLTKHQQNSCTQRETPRAEGETDAESDNNSRLKLDFCSSSKNRERKRKRSSDTSEKRTKVIKISVHVSSAEDKSNDGDGSSSDESENNSEDYEPVKQKKRSGNERRKRKVSKKNLENVSSDEDIIRTPVRKLVERKVSKKSVLSDSESNDESDSDFEKRKIKNGDNII